jgi:hypothetical protein
MAVAEVSGYQYLGCFFDSQSRILDAARTSADSMTVESCADYCSGISDSRFYRLIGVENSVECYCGDDYARDPGTSNDGGCTVRCAGKTEELCGGVWHINIYNATAIPATKTALRTHLPTSNGSTSGQQGQSSSKISHSALSAIIAVSVISAVFGFSLLALLGLWLCKRTRKDRKHSPPMAEESRPYTVQAGPGLVKLHHEDPATAELLGTPVAHLP